MNLHNSSHSSSRPNTRLDSPNNRHRTQTRPPQQINVIVSPQHHTNHTQHGTRYGASPEQYQTSSAPLTQHQEAPAPLYDESASGVACIYLLYLYNAPFGSASFIRPEYDRCCDDFCLWNWWDHTILTDSLDSIATSVLDSLIHENK